MRALMILFVVMFLVLGKGYGQTADEDAGIQALINDQFAAFHSGDLTRAFDDASPTIQMMFGTADNFAHLVQGRYAPIWGAAEVRYLGLRSEAGRLLERVMVRDAQGVATLYDYEMVRVDGKWRINGVYPVAASGISV